MHFTLPQARAFATLARRRETEELASHTQAMRLAFHADAKAFDAAMKDLNHGE